MFITQVCEENCHTHDKECPIHRISIAGSTGDVYTVIISHLPTCSCPNTSFKRSDSGQALCKHVLYVLHYVLKVPEHLRYQNAFLTSELKEITANAPALPTVVIEKEETHDGNRKPIEDDCPICCMEFAKDDKVTWCRAACGDNIHQDCFDLWTQTKKAQSYLSLLPHSVARRQAGQVWRTIGDSGGCEDDAAHWWPLQREEPAGLRLSDGP